MKKPPLLSLRQLGLAAAMAALTLAGCATLGYATPEQQVQERANAFWSARQKADPKAAYELLTPSYRGLRTERDFVKDNGGGIAVQKVEVVKVTCEEADKCTARIAITGKPSVPGLNLPSITSYMDDAWVQEQGQWWRFLAP